MAIFVIDVHPFLDSHISITKLPLCMIELEDPVFESCLSHYTACMKGNLGRRVDGVGESMAP